MTMKYSSGNGQPVSKIKGFRQFMTSIPRHVSENPGNMIYYIRMENRIRFAVHTLMICLIHILRRMKTVQIVQYERVAMVEKVGHVRITFDRNIEGSSEVSRFFHNNIHGVPAFESGIHILEVKYDELLPDSIRRVLREVELRRTSYSKYYYTRRNQVLA